MIPYVLLILGVILVLGILVAILAFKRKSKGELREPDYRVFFILGICFTGMGVVFMTTISTGFIGIMGLGIVYMIIGLANRDKWKK
jgi:hypothetical protein